MDRLSEGSRIADALAGGDLAIRIPVILGTAVFWLVFILFLAAAVDQLQVDTLSNLLAELARYWPNVLGGLFILLVGLVLGNAVDAWVSSTLATAGIANAETLGGAARFGTVFIALVMAADQIGIESRFLIIAAGVLLAVGASGVALAFALGVTPAVNNLIASHYASQWLAAGSVVRFGDIAGIVREITPTSIVLENHGREILVPAKTFFEEAATVEEPTDSQ